MLVELDERKKRILEALIYNYLQTGEPVGSRTISKYSDVALSSATIRNEMADLEELGYITQPYTSAGRIPTDEGYRFYVKSLLENYENDIKSKDRQIQNRELQIDNLKKRLKNDGDNIECVMQDVASILADDTNYTTIITSSRSQERRIKFIQISKLEERRMLVVVVMDGNIIRNKVFQLENDISDEAVVGLNMMLNTSINGLSISKLKNELERVKKEKTQDSVFVSQVYSIVLETVENTEDVNIYTSGTTNIFRYPELSVSETAKELINTFEKKNPLSFLVSEEDAPSTDRIRFYIGQESPVESMRNCSVITTTYKLKDGVKGTIGIIGPKRMNYQMVVETLNNIRLRLDDLFDDE